VRSQETDTVLLLRRWRNICRSFRNKAADETLGTERYSVSDDDFSQVAPLVNGRLGKEVFVTGDPEHVVSIIMQRCWLFAL